MSESTSLEAPRNAINNESKPVVTAINLNCLGANLVKSKLNKSKKYKPIDGKKNAMRFSQKVNS